MYSRLYVNYIMVVPCLTCTHMATHEYTYNKETTFYDYHLTCELGIVLPDPMPKDGFTCDKYENKLATMPHATRSGVAVEIKRE